MTCDEVRDLLPEHLLGTLEGPEDLEIRRHLRGCAACRDERMKLEEGVSALSRAVHDQEPPSELRDRVLGTLGEEWEETGRVPTSVPSPGAGRERLRWRAFATAAVLILVVGSIAFGFAQRHRASLATTDAQSYRNLLVALGGKDFRIGELRPAEGSTMQGQVLIYDGGNQESGKALVQHIRTHYGTNRVDYVVNSHPDADHASGLAVVLEGL